jgi:hypothetical protein
MHIEDERLIEHSVHVMKLERSLDTRRPGDEEASSNKKHTLDICLFSLVGSLAVPR